MCFNLNKHQSLIRLDIISLTHTLSMMIAIYDIVSFCISFSTTQIERLSVTCRYGMRTPELGTKN